jgi:hypothetical protein
VGHREWKISVGNISITIGNRQFKSGNTPTHVITSTSSLMQYLQPHTVVCQYRRAAQSHRQRHIALAHQAATVATTNTQKDLPSVRSGGHHAATATILLRNGCSSTACPSCNLVRLTASTRGSGSGQRRTGKR